MEWASRLLEDQVLAAIYRKIRAFWVQDKNRNFKNKTTAKFFKKWKKIQPHYHVHQTLSFSNMKNSVKSKQFYTKNKKCSNRKIYLLKTRFKRKSKKKGFCSRPKWKILISNQEKMVIKHFSKNKDIWKFSNRPWKSQMTTNSVKVLT